MKETETLQWSEVWKKKINAYVTTPPRTAHFIVHLLGGNFNSAIEMGCFSARDSLKLSSSGYKCTATDYDQDLINFLKEKNKGSSVEFRAENVFDTKFSANSFDLVFHNGLIIYFEKDKIRDILKENFRISKHYVLVLAHNALNTKLMGVFQKKAASDQVFNITFFTPDELQTLASEVFGGSAKVKVSKFGGIIDILYQKHIKGFYNPFQKIAPFIVPVLYTFLPWSRVERVAMLIEKKK